MDKCYDCEDNEMNKEERVINTINRKHIDFLPSQITFSDRTRDKEISLALGLASERELDDYLENHLKLVFTNHDAPLFERNDMDRMKECEALGYAKIDDINHVVYDCWGNGVMQDSDGLFIKYHPLQGNYEANKWAEKYLPESFNRDVLHMDLEEAVKKYKAPDYNQKDNFKHIKKSIEDNNGEFFIINAGYFGIYERSYGILGWEEFMTELALRPNLVLEILEKVTEFKVHEAKEKIKLGLKVGHTGDDLGSQYGPLFSRDMFRKYILPFQKRLFSVYKDAGIPVAFHSCGYITEFIPDLIDIGLDILEPIQPCMDLAFLKKEYGAHIIFWGGINVQQLPFMTPEEVKKMTKDTIWTLGRGGGLIIAPSQEITKDVPIENIKALVEVIIEERKKVLL